MLFLEINFSEWPFILSSQCKTQRTTLHYPVSFSQNLVLVKKDTGKWFAITNLPVMILGQLAATPGPPQVIGRLFSPSQKLKKLTQRFRQCFQLDMGILNATAKFFWWFMDLIESYRACKVSDFKVKIALQKWSHTSLKSILVLHNMKKWAKNINMTF